MIISSNFDSLKHVKKYKHIPVLRETNLSVIRNVNIYQHRHKDIRIHAFNPGDRIKSVEIISKDNHDLDISVGYGDNRNVKNYIFEKMKIEDVNGKIWEQDELLNNDNRFLLLSHMELKKRGRIMVKVTYTRMILK